MSTTEYDAVIVGAGIAGSIMAERLASAGLGVLVLEAGPTRNSRQEHMRLFYQKAAKVPGAPWPHDNPADSPGVLDSAFGPWNDGSQHYLHQTGPFPFASTYERVAGGTGNHWQGLTPRLLPNDFKVGSKYGSPECAPDWPISYEDLEPWYTKAEHFIGVSGDGKEWKDYGGIPRSDGFPMPKLPMTYSDTVLKELLKGKKISGKELHLMTVPQARNSIGWDGRPPCMGNTNCIPICPIMAKYDGVIHLDRAARKIGSPASISYKSVASKIDVDPMDGKVTGICYLDWEGKEHVARGKKYVLSANAIETAKLMLMSPWKCVDGVDVTVGNRSDQVGRNLMDHLIYLSWGLVRKPVYGFRGPIATTTIGEFRDHNKRGKYAPWIISISNTGWGWAAGAPNSTVQRVYRECESHRGKVLKKKVAEHIARQISFTAELEQLPSPYNRVQLSNFKDALNLPKPKISYTLTPYSRTGFVKVRETMDEIFKAISEENGQATAHRSGAPNSFDIDGETFQFHGAGHIMGTTRMGDCADSSVVNPDLRCHDHENLFVVGSAVFPTCGTANPTLTIAALAMRAANTIIAED